MEIIASATERTTAATDLLLSLAALGAFLYLARIGVGERSKRALWMTLFALLAVAGVLGAVVHGLQLPATLRALIWYPLNLLLVLLVSLFGAVAGYDLLGERGTRRLLPPMLLVGLAVYSSLYIGNGTFLWVILYNAVVMLLALLCYLVVAVRGTLAGAWLMVAGLALTIAAAGVQAAEGVVVTLIWEFDHNGLFHLVQLAGVMVLVAGLRVGLRVGLRGGR